MVDLHLPTHYCGPVFNKVKFNTFKEVLLGSFVDKPLDFVQIFFNKYTRRQSQKSSINTEVYWLK